MYCAICKKENEDDSIYCIHCGSRIATIINQTIKNRYGDHFPSPRRTLREQLIDLSTNPFVIIIIISIIIFYVIDNNFHFGKKIVPTPRGPKLPELCNRNGTLKRCNDFINQGNARSCINLSTEFFKSCGDYDQLHYYRNTAAREVSEWNIALDSANHLVELYPFSAQSYFARAGTYKDSGNYQSAITDYEQTLLLMPGEIQAPFELANLYQRIGKPCLGIPPLDMFNYQHPELNSNAGTILNTLNNKPECAYLHTNGKAKIRISKDGRSIESKAIINDNFSGNFIIDSGASTVVLAKSFAERMKLDYLTWPKVMVQTANGAVDSYRGYIDSVSVQGLKSKHVEVVVQDKLGNIDGLLGLTFLSRFKIEMDAGKGYLTITSK